MEPATYLRPLVLSGRPAGARPALRLAGLGARFAEVERIRRGADDRRESRVTAADPDDPRVQALCRPRPPVCGLALDRPRVMGVVNVTPDSFSDGGRHDSAQAAVDHGRALVEAGADILDIGGESTRPGAAPTPLEEERRRVTPVIEGLLRAGVTTPLSIDTRKAAIAREAFALGARMFNDVSALSFDPESLETAAALTAGPDGGWVVLNHAQGDPRTMQDNPRYRDAPLDVYDALEARQRAALTAGVPADRLLVDPGLGFGKALSHNKLLIAELSLLHGLGAPLLVGASRKGMIGALSGEKTAHRRAPGSVAAALAAAAQAAHFLRAHDVWETAQALTVWHGLTQIEEGD